MKLSNNTDKVIKVLGIIGMVLFVVCVILAVSGCSALTPIATVEHTSHATQHFGANQGSAGWNTVGFGVRARYRGVTLDVTEGYAIEQVDGRHEVFNARLLWEVGKP